MEDENQATTYLLTTRQAAAYVGVGENVIRNLSRRKYNPLPHINIPGCQYPKYTRELLTDYFSSLAVDAEGR